MPIQETSENDLHQLRANDCGYNEGTICLVMGELAPRGLGDGFSSVGT